MVQRKRFLRIFASLTFGLFLIGMLSGILTAAPAEKPVTGKEWMAKSGMDWGTKYYPAKPVRGGIANYASPLYIGLMNPNHWPVNDWVTMGAFYDKLIVTDGKYRPTVPMLAESWKYLDNVTVVMKLRQGVQFHDGSPFNAEGLKYQMDWIMDAKNGAWTRAWMEPVASVEVMDNYTVKWHFKRPWAGFLGVMSNVPGYVISAKALKADVALRESKQLAGQVEREKKNVAEAEKEVAASTGEVAEKAKAKLEAARKKLAPLEEEYKKAAALAAGAKELDNNPVGTGPWIFEEGNPGNYLKLKRNPNWWFAKFVGMDMPYYDGIKTNIIPDPSVRVANLRAGKIDSLVLDPSQIAMFKNERQLQMFKNNTNWIVGLRFNVTAGPCKDIRVRKAISHAIDRKALIAGVDFGLGRIASCMYPEDHWCHNPNLKPVTFDPELSKKLLVQAGYKNGLTIKGYMSNLTQSTSLAEAIKGMLAKVGITWNIEFLDPAASSEKLRKVDYDFAGGGWQWIYDPDLMATGLYHPDGGFNFGRSDNKKAVALIEAGRLEIDFDKRTKIYWELEKVLYDNYEDVWLWWPRYVSVTRKNVQGINNDMGNQFKEAFSVSHPSWFKGGKENR
jgi:ABC-type transport system substrate-binding protein